MINLFFVEVLKECINKFVLLKLIIICFLFPAYIYFKNHFLYKSRITSSVIDCDKSQKHLMILQKNNDINIILLNKINYIPKISVIIHISNSGKNLSNCLENVINQTLMEIEIICIDDDSTDNSLDILKKYGEKDKRITIIHIRIQSDIAKNIGLNIAKGKYLSFLDSDIILELNMLEEMYKTISKYQSDIIICRCKFINLNTEKNNKQIFDNCLKTNLIPKRNNFSTLGISKNIFQFCKGWTSDKLFRTDFILSNNIKFQNISYFNDFYFTYTAIFFSKNIF